MSDQNISLRALVQQASDIELMLLENGGELTPEVEKQLEILDVATPVKIDNYFSLMERFDALKAVFKKKSEDMAQISKSYDAANERLKYNLREAMGIAELDELKGNDYRFKLCDSPPAVIIENEDAVPSAYKVVTQTTKIDKKRIGEDLAIGVPVPGCSLSRSRSLRKYINSGAK